MQNDDAARRKLRDHEQMADAQSECVPCSLCGGRAIITDAGIGAGYYIRCENIGAFRRSEGCMLGDQRLGGWAYNVRDWWNRLHAYADRLVEAETERCARVAESEAEDIEAHYTQSRDSWAQGRIWMARTIAAAIRLPGAPNREEG